MNLSLLRKIRPLAKAPSNTDQLAAQLAAGWLARRTGTTATQAFAQLQQAGFFLHILWTDSPAWIRAFPARNEGKPDRFTPEIIAQLDELSAVGRNQHGIFYTPYPLARALSRELLHAYLTTNGVPGALPPAGSPAARALDNKLAQLTVCDPAAGAGGLLIPFWFELVRLRHQLNPAHDEGKLLLSVLQHNLYAADVRPQALYYLRLRAALTLLARGVKLPKNLLPNMLPADALSGAPTSVWASRFPSVFKQGGFTVVLSNPPYVGQKNHRDLFAPLRKNPRWQDKIFPHTDLLYLFFYLGLEITRPGGLMGFITTPYFTHAAGAAHLRRTLARRTACLRLVDFEDVKPFPQAKGPHTLLSVFCTRPSADTPCRCGTTPHTARVLQAALYQGPTHLLQTRPVPAQLQQALTKMARAPHTLGQIATISNGLMSGCDQISAAHLRRFSLPGVQKGTGVFVLSLDETNALALTETEKKKLKPFFKNSDIAPYRAAQMPSHFLLDFFYPNDRNLDFARYPHLLAHLARFKPVLLARKQNNNGIHKQLAKGHYWFGSVRRKMDFECEKIVVPYRVRQNTFGFAPGPWYASSDVYFISAPRAPFTLWYLLALFNSAPYYAWLFYRGKRKGKLLELYAAPLSALPVPTATPAVRAQLTQLAQAQFEKYDEKRQQQINVLVGQLFGFSATQLNAAVQLQAAAR